MNNDHPRRRFPGGGIPLDTVRIPMAFKLASIVGLVVMITALVALIRDHSLFGESPIPIGVQILAFSLMVWARVTFGGRSFHAAANPTAGGVVTSGPYRFVRHPIYAAVIYFTWAGVLSHLSILNLVLGICTVAGAALRIVAEEKLLVDRYPEYRGYANRTKRILPFLI
jgi:protein-S-isoprenylcysteine O-methyltransferase Ste14